MSIKKKLFTSFGIIIFILIGLAAFSINKLSTIDNNYTYLMEDRAYGVIEASKVQNAVSLQGLYIRSYVLRKDRSELDSLYAQRDLVAEKIKEL